MSNLVSFSGGKNSTALLLLMVEQKIPIDEVIFCDTGKEFPQIYDHIQKIEKDLSLPLTILKPEHGFDYYMYEHVKERGSRAGEKGYSWMTMSRRWCTSYLKTGLINAHVRNKYKNQKYTHFVGIAFNEYKRYKKKTELQYPLIEQRITDGMALKMCYDHGYDFGGYYTLFNRQGCWCCPLQSKKDLFILYSFYPDLWQELKEMDEKARTKFRYKESVLDLEREFKKVPYV